MPKSRYLESDRLAHVIAAIQILGVSDQTSATLNRWVAELEASEGLTNEHLELTPIKFAERKKWAAVFEQHPEFFKSYTLHGEQHVLLRLRYAQSFNKLNSLSKSNAGNEAQTGTDDQAQSNDSKQQASVVGVPLNPEQIQMLIRTAIDLRAQEAAAGRKPDLSPLLMIGVGAALGTIMGGSAIVLLGWLQMTHIQLFN
jgi:hypothetical protein